MKTLIRAAIASGLAAVGAEAQTVEQVRSYEWSSGEPFPSVNFDSFDDMGGTRVLTGVSLSLDGSYFMSVAAENQDKTPVEAGDWFVEYGYVTFIEAGEKLFVPPIDSAFTHEEPALGPYDGVDGSGEDYVAFEPLGGVADGFYPFPESDFHAFTSGASIPVLAQFLGDISLPPPPPTVFVDVLSASQSGDLTLTYSYSVVPAPASCLLLGLGVSFSRRVRR